MSVFEDVVLFLGRRQVIDELAREVGVEATEPARVGVVLSLPVVLANLARWVETPARGAWLLERLDAVEPSAAADYPSLVADIELRHFGAEVLDLVLGQPRDDITERIATRAAVSSSAADGLLRMTSAAVLAHLAVRHRSSIGGEALTDELASERRQLVVGGWEPWMSETERSIGAPSPVGQAHGSVAYPPPEARDSTDDRRRAVAPARGRSRGADGDASGGDDPATGLGSLPAGPPNGRSPGRSTPGSASPWLRSSTAVSFESDPRTGRVERVPPARGPRPERERRSGRRIEPAPVLVFTGLAIAIALAGFALFSLLSGAGDGADVVADEGSSPSVDVTTSLSETSLADTDTSATEAAADGDRDGASLSVPIGQQVVAVPLADPLDRTDGTGAAELRFDPVTGEICFVFEADGVAGPYDGHIHVGPVGVKGGIVVDFGQLEGNPSGCVENSPAGTAAILGDLSGHYVEFHDADDVTTIRAQLGKEVPGASAASSSTDAESERGGAVTKIEAGRLVLSGEVPDQVTIDKLVETFVDIDLGSTELVNELTIVPGSPRPSGNIVVDDAIFFDFDSDQLVDPESTVLTDLATIFTARPAWSMTVVGHTDSSGTDVYNLELSLRRAAAVRDALIAAGVAEEALTIEGAGSTDPIAANDTAAGRAQNRRIEIEVTPG